MAKGLSHVCKGYPSLNGRGKGGEEGRDARGWERVEKESNQAMMPDVMLFSIMHMWRAFGPKLDNSVSTAKHNRATRQPLTPNWG